MSENDPRFGYPIEFVKEHVLGCFEASKACALLPGKPHLYHVEFLKREDSTEIKNGSALPLDFYLQAHFSPCDEVSWYLHTRKDFPVYEGSEQADAQYVAENAEGKLDFSASSDDFIKQQEELDKQYMSQVAQQRLRENLGMLAAVSVPTTPENFTDSQTVTDGYGQGRKAKSRYDRIKAELEASLTERRIKDGD